MRGQRGRLPVQPLGYVMSTKVIFRRAKVIVLANLSSKTSACRPTSVWCLKEKQRFHVMADEVDLTSACGRLGRQTSARLKITFTNMTYPGQHHEPPSLSPHFLLIIIIYYNLCIIFGSCEMRRLNQTSNLKCPSPQNIFFTKMNFCTCSKRIAAIFSFF